MLTYDNVIHDEFCGTEKWNIFIKKNFNKNKSWNDISVNFFPYDNTWYSGQR